jgi:Domain of unknown function (DUF1707)
MLRVSDEDRERAASELREHYAAGRLDADELADRLGRVLAARTNAELDAARADLPAITQSAEAAHRARRSQLTRQLVQRTGYALVPFLVCTAIWLLGGASGGFWPTWVALIAVVPLVRNGWRLYGPAPDLDAADEELAGPTRRARTRAARR